MSSVGREAGKKAVEAIVNYFLARLGGRESDAKMAMETAQQAIAANTEVAVKALDAMREVSRAALDQRPAAKQLVAPVSETADTVTLGERERAFVVDGNAKARIEDKAPVSIGTAQIFTVRITELDTKTGACKVELQTADQDSRYDGTITDPVVNQAHSPYSAALDSQDWIAVTAKPHIQDGELTRLTISDTA